MDVVGLPALWSVGKQDRGYGGRPQGPNRFKEVREEGRGKLDPYTGLDIASLVQKPGKRRAQQAACGVGVELASTLFPWMSVLL